MVDFKLSDNDRDILKSVAAEAKASEKYARYYEEHEDEVLPKAFPEAKGFPSLLERIRQYRGVVIIASAQPALLDPELLRKHAFVRHPPA